MREIAALTLTGLNLLTSGIIFAYVYLARDKAHNLYYLVKPTGMVAATFYSADKCFEYRNMYRQTHRLYYTCTP